MTVRRLNIATATNEELDALAIEQDADRPPEYTDEALALRFAEHHAHDLRYVAAWGRWLHWDGQRWKFDDTWLAMDFARAICRQASADCGDKRISPMLASAKEVAAVEKLSKADRRLAATVDQWDLDPWSLNTPAGILDLRTGDMSPHRPEGYHTKITGVSPSNSDIPTWRQFLDVVTNGDVSLQQFLQRVAGYALTGITREHAMFFGYGTGGNGKGVFVNTIAKILADYHRTAPIEAFTASHNDRHPTDLAGLRGARLVTSTETQEGRRWDETKIKTLTGGDVIAARFMRQDFFEYQPQFKLLITGNHKPGLRSVDEAIRRRFHLIPFVVTIPPEQRDKDMAEKLKAEWPGILQWAVDGCMDWQERGHLAPPDIITKATADYLEAQDAITAWVDECCSRDPNGWESRSALFDSWKAWAKAAEEFVGTRPRFLDAIYARGFADKRQAGTGLRGCVGFKLKRAFDEP